MSVCAVGPAQDSGWQIGQRGRVCSNESPRVEHGIRAPLRWWEMRLLRAKAIIFALYPKTDRRQLRCNRGKEMSLCIEIGLNKWLGLVGRDSFGGSFFPITIFCGGGGYSSLLRTMYSSSSH